MCIGNISNRILILTSLGKCQLKTEERYVIITLICDLGCKDIVWKGSFVESVQGGGGLVFLGFNLSLPVP